MRAFLTLTAGVSGWILLLLPYSKRNPVLNTNIIDSDQMLHSAASDLGLHCSPMSLLRDARHKWVNILADNIWKY